MKSGNGYLLAPEGACAFPTMRHRRPCPALPRYQAAVDALEEDLKNAALVLFALARQRQELFQEWHRDFELQIGHGREAGVDVPPMRLYEHGSLKVGNALIKDMLVGSIEALEDPSNSAVFNLVVSQMDGSK